MALWLQFSYNNGIRLGVLEGDAIHIYSGDLFNDPQPVGESCNLAGDQWGWEHLLLK